MEYALFLGCVAPLRYPEIESSIRSAMERLGVELHDMKGASCCPAPGIYPHLDERTWLALGARNLCLAENMECDIMTICNGCQLTLDRINNELSSDSILMKEVNSTLSTVDMRFRGTIKVKHFIDVLYEDIGIEQIKKETTSKLRDLKAAPFYGCHYLAFHHIKTSKRLEKLIEGLGAKNIEYDGKNECCGAGEGIRSTLRKLSLEIALSKIKNVAKANADCVVDICPFCHLQLDQAQDRGKSGKKYYVPVVNYAQLLGLALGIPPFKLGVDIRRTRTTTYLERVNTQTYLI